MLRVFRGSSVVLFLFFLFIVVCSGCNKHIVRDAKVYAAEIAFVGSAANEQVENALALMKVSCECREPDGLPLQFVTRECLDMAQTVVVVRARMDYHLAYMQYLGGLIKERPSDVPPEVPEANTLCGEMQ